MGFGDWVRFGWDLGEGLGELQVRLRWDLGGV